MIQKLLRRRRTITEPAIPEGQRVYAVGDVHGRLDLLDILLTRIDDDDGQRPAADTTLIFLGDLVDRGPDSAGVIERVRQLADARPHVRCLLGNHEEIFLGALDGEPKALRLFCRIGGRETAISYGIAASDYERLDYEEFSGRLAKIVPSLHRDFVSRFEDMIVIGDYVFVHAGVRPGTPLSEQRGADLRWIRDPFLDHRVQLEKMVVHGHTMADAVAYRPHRIGVDTGAYESGKLTALGLYGTATWEVSAQIGSQEQ